MPTKEERQAANHNELYRQGGKRKRKQWCVGKLFKLANEGLQEAMAGI